MTVTRNDLTIFHWAWKRSYPCGYVRLGAWPNDCLRIELDHATVYFNDERLIRVVAHDDGRQTESLVREMASVFALCAYLEIRESVEETATAPIPNTPTESEPASQAFADAAGKTPISLA
jgi:hypothetical protein